MKFSASTLFIACLILFGTHSCKTTSSNGNEQDMTEEKNSESPSGTFEMPSEENLFVKLRRTPCFGKCPDYLLSIYHDGTAIYEGRRFVDMVGKYRFRVDQEQMNRIREKAEEIGFFELKDVYPSGDRKITDLPATRTMIRYEFNEKEIINKNYIDPDLPAEKEEVDRLKSLEDLIDSFWKGADLIKIPDVSGQ